MNIASEQSEVVNEFNVAEFKEIYPQFEAILDAKLQYMYKLAKFIFLQTTNHLSKLDTEMKESLLWLLVCHLASLEERGNALVGSLSSASEGSVSSSFEFAQKLDAAWFNQSQCGASYRQIIQPYPKAKYYSGK